MTNFCLYMQSRLHAVAVLACWNGLFGADVDGGACGVRDVVQGDEELFPAGIDAPALVPGGLVVGGAAVGKLCLKNVDVAVGRDTAGNDGGAYIRHGILLK